MSGRKKRNSQLHSAIDVLQSLFKKSKTGFSSEYNRVRLEQDWAQIVGEDLAKETHPRKIYKTTLYIVVESSEARYHMNFSKDVILKKINQFLETHKIEHISFKAAPPPDKENKYTDKEKQIVNKMKAGGKNLT